MTGEGQEIEDKRSERNSEGESLFQMWGGSYSASKTEEELLTTPKEHVAKKSRDWKVVRVKVRNRVNNGDASLLEVFKEEAQRLIKKSDILSLALAIAPGQSLPEAFVIIYNGLGLTQEELIADIREYMAGGRWDRLSYASLSIVEDLLGLKRDSLYRLFRDD